MTTDTNTVALTIGANPGNGTLSGCSTSKASAGIATFSACSINNIGNGYTLTAADSTDKLTGQSAAFNLVAPVASSFSIVPSTNTPTAGTQFSAQITALDQSGYTFTGYTGTQVINFTGPSSSPNKNAPVYPASVSFAGGVGTAKITVYDAQATTLTAAQGSITGSAAITVGSTGTATAYSVANPGSQTAGIQFGVSISAVDTYGNVVTGYTGTKTLTFSGPGSSPGGTAPKYPTNGSVTFSAGTATPNVTLYNASTSTSTNLTVTLGSITGSTGAFTVTGSATANSFTVTNPGTQTAGTPFNVSVTAVDAWGNTATAYTGNQTLGFSGPGTSPGGNAPSYPTGGVVGFNNGSATIPITLYKSSTTTNLTLSQSGTTGSTGTFTVSPAGTSTFNVANPGTQTAGIAFGVSITATDAWGNTTPSYTGNQTLSFSGAANAPNGTAPKYPTSGVVSFSAGVGTATMTLYDGSTTTNVTATQGSLTDTTGIFTVNGGATAVSFSVTNPGTQTAGTQFGLSIAAIDTWGNTATGYTGTKTLTFSGPGSSPGGTAPKYPTNGSVTFSAGTATPNVTLYNASASTNLTVTLGSITGSTGAFTVTGSASANSFTVTNPGTQTAGTPFNVSVTAVDAWGNTATAYTGNQTLGFSGPGTSPGGNAPSYPTGGVVGFNNGSATIPITLYKSSTTTNLTLSQSGTTGSTGTFTVSPAGTSTFNVANPGTQTAGIAFGVSITATDAWGNTTPSYTGNQTLSFSGAANAPNGTAPKYPTSGVVSFSAGVGTATMTLYDGSTTTNVTATQGSLTDTTGIFTVNGGATAVSFSVTNPGTQTAGTQFGLSIAAIDTWGNTATGYTGTKTLTFSGPGSSPGGTAPKYPTNGSVTFSAGTATPNVTLYNASASTNLTVNVGSVTGSTGTFTVSPAGASAFNVANPGTQTAGTQFGVSITALDTWGNTATSYTGNQTLSFSGAGSSPGGNAPKYPTNGVVSFSAGVATATMTLYNASATTNVTATQGSLSDTTGNFTVNPIGASAFNVANPGTETAGIAFGVPITAIDTWGNTATSYTGNQTLTFSGAANAPNGHLPKYPTSGVVSFSAGNATATMTLYDGSATTNVTATQGSLTDTTGIFTVNGGAAAVSFSVVNPGTQTAGTAFGVSITAIDTWGNTATGYTGTKTLTFSGPGFLAGRQRPELPDQWLGDLQRRHGHAQRDPLQRLGFDQPDRHRGLGHGLDGHLHGEPGRHQRLQRGQPGDPDGRHPVRCVHHCHRQLGQHHPELHGQPDAVLQRGGDLAGRQRPELPDQWRGELQRRRRHGHHDALQRLDHDQRDGHPGLLERHHRQLHGQSDRPCGYRPDRCHHEPEPCGHLHRHHRLGHLYVPLCE